MIRLSCFFDFSDLVLPYLLYVTFFKHLLNGCPIFGIVNFAIIYTYRCRELLKLGNKEMCFVFLNRIFILRSLG